MAYKLQCEKKFKRRKAKPTPFCRIMNAKYDEATNTVSYYHPTKGWKARKGAPEFMARLSVG